MAIDPHQLFKQVISDNAGERHNAADKLRAAKERGEFHPDDFRLKPDKATSLHASTITEQMTWQMKLAAAEGERKIALVEMQAANARTKREKERTEREAQAREKAEAEVEKLKAQLSKARSKTKPTGPTQAVNLRSGLLPNRILDALTVEQVSAKIAALWQEKGNRKQNETAQLDLVLGQLTMRLHEIWHDLHGPHSATPRKRGSNAPTLTEFVVQYAGASASWCQRCLSAFEHVFSEEWPEIEARLDGSVSIENILKAARSIQDRPPGPKRRSKVQRRLDALTEAVRQRAFDEAVDLVQTWESEVQQTEA